MQFLPQLPASFRFNPEKYIRQIITHQRMEYYENYEGCISCKESIYESSNGHLYTIYYKDEDNLWGEQVWGLTGDDYPRTCRVGKNCIYWQRKINETPNYNPFSENSSLTRKFPS
jgi:hypothetical protein